MTFESGKIGAIGDKDSILAFKAIGVEVFVVDTPIEADEVLKTIRKKQYSVVFLTEELASAMTNTLQKLKTNTFPTIILIPSASGAGNGFAQENLKKDIEKALGTGL
ncbi:MAG: V-type ATP synthase subunit F [Firmicutes bacterium]|nr:V-type ATP synthase subunit F [Bacillota bacterium]